MIAKPKRAVFGAVKSERFDEISKYRRIDITRENFGTAINDRNLYRTLLDISLHHPHSVVRHEASFLLGKLNLTRAIPYLISIVKFDKSIVAKHEAAESLGKLGENSDLAYEFLKEMTNLKRKVYEDDVYHADVQATAELAITEIEEKRKLKSN